MFGLDKGFDTEWTLLARFLLLVRSKLMLGTRLVVVSKVAVKIRLLLEGCHQQFFTSLIDFNPALTIFNAQPLYSYQQAAL